MGDIFEGEKAEKGKKAREASKEQESEEDASEIVILQLPLILFRPAVVCEEKKKK